MNDYAFYLSPHELVFFQAIIRHLPPSFVDIYVGSPRNPLKGKALPWKLASECDPEIRQLMSSLTEAGYSLRPVTNESLQHYQKAVCSSAFFSPRVSGMDLDRLRQMACAVLFHAMDVHGRGNLAPRWYILPSQRQAQTPQQGKADRKNSAKLFHALSGLPRDWLNEYAYSGPYHLGEWEQKRLLPKNVLRVELEEKLGCSLPAGKPVVAFLQDEFCHPRQVAKALAALSRHVTLIVKGFSIEVPDSALAWPDKGPAPNLLRFAADYILAGYRSGTLVSSLMLGLRVIPYYTTLIHYGGHRFGKLSKYVEYLPQAGKAPYVCTDILSRLQALMNLEDTDALLDLLDDEKYWRQYSAELPQIQKEVFGDYCIEGAAAKTALLLVRAFTRGTFGEDTTAIRLRPEYGSLVKGKAPCQQGSAR